jgi:hypothetical protein
MSPRSSLLLLVALATVGCRERTRELDPVPAELSPRVDAANAAIGDLKQTLSGRLVPTVQKQGPKAGIEVCSGDAAKLTREVGERHGVQIGRSSARLRNAKSNTAPTWLAGYIERVSAQKAKDAKPAVYDLGDRLGVAQPLGVQPLCLTCHGDPATIPPDVKAALSERYPGDRATGYSEGDVRGVVWVEIAKK